MTFSSSTDPKVLKEELTLLESLTQKAIEGRMEEADFVKFVRLFDNVPKAQYSDYMEHILPHLSNENLHKLVAGLAKQAALGAAKDTFLRDNNILKGLLLAEARRYNFDVSYTKGDSTVTLPTKIPDALLDHFAMLVSDESTAKAFDSTVGQGPDVRLRNIQTSIIFNILKNLVKEATEDKMETQKQADLLQGLENIAGELKDYFSTKAKVGGNGMIEINVPALTFEPAQAKEGVEGIAKIAARKAVEKSTNQAYKDLLSKQDTLDQLANIESEIEGYYNNPFGDIHNLVKQHKALRKEAGVKYTFGEDSKFYKLIMSGNENTVARLIDQMLNKTSNGGNNDKSKLQVDLNEDVLFKNSPPELLLKMKEIADKLVQREGGKVSNFRDGLNKFANGMKRAFSFGAAGISDSKIKEALEEVERTATYNDKVSEGPKRHFQRQTSGLFTDSVSKKAPVQMHTSSPVNIHTPSSGEKER